MPAEIAAPAAARALDCAFALSFATSRTTVHPRLPVGQGVSSAPGFAPPLGGVVGVVLVVVGGEVVVVVGGEVTVGTVGAVGVSGTVGVREIGFFFLPPLPCVSSAMPKPAPAPISRTP